MSRVATLMKFIPRKMYKAAVRLNKTERAFEQRAEGKGQIVTKRGWPDYFGFESDGTPFAVEVKPFDEGTGKHQRLTYEQTVVMCQLHRLGLACYVYSGQQRFHRFRLKVDGDRSYMAELMSWKAERNKFNKWANKNKKELAGLLSNGQVAE